MKSIITTEEEETLRHQHNQQEKKIDEAMKLAKTDAREFLKMIARGEFEFLTKEN